MSNGSNKIEMIAVNKINILNPRIRNKKIFNDISDNILKVGLKRPITVTKSSSSKSDKEYDLVCGQGRLEAFIAAGQKLIPALVRDATEEQALIMSLVENLARRQHSSLYLMNGIEILINNGYSAKQISEKTGLSNSYARNIIHLIQNGEERLLSAVEAGKIPMNVAIGISNADDDLAQNALQEAYESKQLVGSKLMFARKLVEMRKSRGKGIASGGKRGGGESKLSAKDLIQIYQKEVDRKRLISRKAEMVSNRLTFLGEALRRLFKEDAFKNLLIKEELDTMPKQLTELLHNKKII